MKGRMLIIGPNGDEARVDYTEPVALDDLQKAVGGYIELIPHFDTYQGERCRAFCNEEGKLRHLDLPFNGRATAAWSRALDGRSVDALVGYVAIVTGDDDFMAEL